MHIDYELIFTEICFSNVNENKLFDTASVRYNKHIQVKH